VTDDDDDDDDDNDDDDNDDNDDDNDDDDNDSHHSEKLRLIFSDFLEFVWLNYAKMRPRIKLLSINCCM
jgi:hypothetical protein